jgi:hypothetical protein
VPPVERGCHVIHQLRRAYVLEKCISGEAVCDVIKTCIEAAGYDPSAFSGHSPLSGFTKHTIGVLDYLFAGPASGRVDEVWTGFEFTKVS